MKRRAAVRLGAAATTCVVGASLIVAWAMRPDRAAGPCVVIDGPALLPEIPEASGLAVSRRDPKLLWSHNDSGNSAVLFALDTAGIVRGQVRVPVRSGDWEDISAARCPAGDCLYIADIGDNGLTRRGIHIYRVPEPAPGDAETGRPEVFNATYADGPHNAEAMFVAGAEIFIVTRDRVGGLYRSTITGSSELRFRRVGQLGLAAVTDAEASRDEKSVAVRTSHEVVFYRTADLIEGSDIPYFRVPIDGLKEPQGEGVAVDGSMLYLASEGRPWKRAGRFVSLRCDFPR